MTAPWRKAASFAARAHHGQMRDDGRTPYFAHAARVAMTVAEVFRCHDPVALAAAMLHDTIEDTPTDFDDIEEHFGAETAACVAALTKNMTLREGAREEDYERRLAAGPWQARLVKLADVLDNLSDALDAGHSGPRLAKTLRKCRTALDLAAADAHRPEIAAAIDAVRSAVRRAGG